MATAYPSQLHFYSASLLAAYPPQLHFFTASLLAVAKSI